MEREKKPNSDTADRQRTAQLEPDTASQSGEIVDRINNSPTMVTQRKQLHGIFSDAIQRREKLLHHEARHGVQQDGMQPTRQMKTSVPVNNDEVLEHEANERDTNESSFGNGPLQKQEAPADDLDDADLEYQDDPDNWDATGWEDSESEQKANSPRTESPDASSRDEQESEPERFAGIHPDSELATWFADEKETEGEPDSTSKKHGKIAKGASWVKNKTKAGVRKMADNPTYTAIANGFIKLVQLTKDAIVKGKGMTQLAPVNTAIDHLLAIGGGILSAGSFLLALAGLKNTQNLRNEMKAQEKSEEDSSRKRLLTEGLYDIKVKLANRCVDLVQGAIGIGNMIMAFISGGLTAVVNGAIALANKCLSIARSLLTMAVKAWEKFRSKRHQKRHEDAQTLADGAKAGNPDDCKLIIAMGVPSLVSRVTTKASQNTTAARNAATGEETNESKKGVKIKTPAELQAFANSLPDKATKENNYGFDSFVSEIYNALNKT